MAIIDDIKNKRYLSDNDIACDALQKALWWRGIMSQ